MLKSSIPAPDIVVDLSCSNQIHRYPMDGTERTFNFTVDDVAADHCIRLAMSGKTQAHTLIDSEGNITLDAQLIVSSIIFNEIDVTYVFCLGKRCYWHDGNGSQDPDWDGFFGVMGCNGHVDIEFSTPIRKWFLEHC